MIPQDIANTIVDPRAYADGKRIDHAFAWLRREAPLEQAQPEGFDPFWSSPATPTFSRSSARTSSSTTATAPPSSPISKPTPRSAP